ncbi:conserved hypothetical protein [Leishmania braziliensis MHOM/BR/75/M2904]|uniref:Uncharacterized protein n=1 Tax=Leishmania braziliensis TaxID=5660 RepID=A4HHR2_LEIBR|nr:conserved hypothetical protein [Leishmania braziliensis MHOM/BR/75/M2904]CAJ2476754.1 unnamed protein product [Leishmania braziliensis]CAM40117.1 conserved hypothetical protein [Leishmania braziliensis MHOM/BR/75/M2904]
MAEEARTVRHYVSDCLEMRYPYDASKGFAGIHQREAGRVFNGYGPSAVDDMMNSLMDPSVSTEERTRAAHLLYARSASQETKIEMLKKGLVPMLVATLRRCPDHLLKHQCLLLLRSLGVLPQGCFALVREGAISVVAAELRTDSPSVASLEAAQACYVAAAHVLYQVSSNMSGLRWMLGLSHDPAFEGIEAALVEELLSPEALVSFIAGGLASEAMPATATVYLVQTLARLTSLERGVEAFLAVPGAVDVLVEYLRRLPKLPTQDTELCSVTLEAMWNTSLGHVGRAAMEERGVPDILFELLATTSGIVAQVPVCVQRQLTGALSAVSQLTSVKQRSTQAVSSAEARIRIVVLVDYVREWNTLIATQYTNAAKPVPSAAAAVVTNVVQCIRLASELKPVRDLTYAILDAMEQEGTSEAFYFRRQLYFHTRWEAEFRASVEV